MSVRRRTVSRIALPHARSSRPPREVADGSYTSRCLSASDGDHALRGATTTTGSSHHDEIGTVRKERPVAAR